MGMCGMLRVGVDATARGMKPPILTVAPSIPTAIVSTVWPTSASFALSASPVCSAVGGGGILAIDMDGQANLTESCGLSIEEEQTVYGAMRGEYPLPVIELENGLAVVPSCLDLSAAESELINEPGRELILKGLIAKLLDSRKFDYILIDCPPSLGLLTLNALTTADFLIIPVQAQFLAMRGMAKITSVIEIVKERLNPNLSIGGIVITQFDKRKTLNKSVAEIINDSFCDKVFKTIVRDNVALAEAPIKGKNVFEYNKNCNGAKDYMALAQEVLKLK